MVVAARDAGDVPLKLNVGREPAIGAETRTAETLGTLAFTRQFEGCLESALRSETTEDHLPYSQWYQSPYVVERLPKRIVKPLLQALLAKRAALERLSTSKDPALDDWRTFRASYDETIRKAAQRLGLTHREVAKAEKHISRLLRTELMTYRPTVAKRQPNC